MDLTAISKLLVRLTEPGTVLALCLALGVVLQWLRRRSLIFIGHALTLLAALGFLAIVLFPVDQWFARPLEDRFPRPPWPDQIDGVLLLSAAQQPYLSATRGTPIQQLGEGDMAAVVELLRRYPQARLIFSGGPAGAPMTAADVARGIFNQLGVDQRRVTYENRSRNTWENLTLSRELAQPKPDETWLLVTQALHMPRAMGVAQQIGWRLAPWPTDYLTPGGDAPALRRRSLGRNLQMVDAALHEWVGLVVYRLTGRSAALFPAPADASR
jgi:uncharacterized SAM-binding protein YcdF (DUF218 family)